jgi:murein DD-endopeptidase MepM/ murein hydrolase activator NlpD
MSFHYGIDLAAPYGTPVKAVSKGVVIKATEDVGGFGKHIVVSHSKDVWSRYAHLSKIEVEVGDMVEAGRRIGRVGNTGRTRGKNGLHLHLEMILCGRKRIDPELIFTELRRV